MTAEHCVIFDLLLLFFNEIHLYSNVNSQISSKDCCAASFAMREEKLACKPGSVEHLSAFRQSFIWAGSCLPARATYPGTARAALLPPYLVLLRMGFAMPLLLPETRWALTRRSCDRPCPCGTRTVSPSPDPTPSLATKARLCGLAATKSDGGHRQTILCGTFHRLAASGR